METTDKKVSHTPGPWKITDAGYMFSDYDAFGKPTGNEVGYHVNIQLGKTNVDIWGHSVSKTETEANANVIIIAPEMLAYIKELIDAVENETANYSILERGRQIIFRAEL